MGRPRPPGFPRPSVPSAPRMRQGEIRTEVRPYRLRLKRDRNLIRSLLFQIDSAGYFLIRAKAIGPKSAFGKTAGLVTPVRAIHVMGPGPSEAVYSNVPPPVHSTRRSPLGRNSILVNFGCSGGAATAGRNEHEVIEIDGCSRRRSNPDGLFTAEISGG